MGTTISGATGIDKVQDGTIVNADINSSAAIAGSKLVMPTGSVLQVIRAEITNGPAISTETNTDIGLQASITPISTSSKILAQWSPHVRTQYATETGYGTRLLRGSTSVWDTASSYFIYNTHNRESNRSFYTYNYLDSPNTTSAITYKIQIRSQSSRTLEISDNGNQSTLILMEIAG